MLVLSVGGAGALCGPGITQQIVHAFQHREWSLVSLTTETLTMKTLKCCDVSAAIVSC